MNIQSKLTYCDVYAFAGHPRQFSGLSNYSQRQIADGEIISLVSMPGLLIFFFLILSLILFFLRTRRNEGTNQAPIAAYLRTASTAEQPAIGSAQSSKVHLAVR